MYAHCTSLGWLRQVELAGLDAFEKGFPLAVVVGQGRLGRVLGVADHHRISGDLDRDTLHTDDVEDEA